MGATGSTGPAGTNGMSGYQIVSPASVSGGGASKTIVVTCPSGKNVISGGFTTVTPGDLVSSYPSSSTSWTIIYNQA